MTAPATTIPKLLQSQEEALLADWLKAQQTAPGYRPDLIGENELRRQSAEFLRLFREAVKGGNLQDTSRPEWEPVREMLADVSRTRGGLGFSPTETAMFVFSFKQPLFAALRRELGQDGLALAEQTWAATTLLDQLGLWTTEIHQKTREEVVIRQQAELLELSTPVVKLWEGILALPLIGTLDSARTQVVMEALLQRIVETGSTVAIIDITGVPTVDTLVAQHLLKTITAARLMGAECIISGIRPQIAQTIVHLGVDLAGVMTKATLADAFTLALRQAGMTIQRRPAPAAPGMTNDQ